MPRQKRRPTGCTTRLGWICYVALCMTAFSPHPAQANVLKKLQMRIAKKKPTTPPPPEEKDQFDPKHGTAFLHVAFTVGVIAALYLFPGQEEVEKRLAVAEETETK